MEHGDSFAATEDKDEARAEVFDIFYGSGVERVGGSGESFLVGEMEKDFFSSNEREGGNLDSEVVPMERAFSWGFFDVGARFEISDDSGGERVMKVVEKL